MEHKPFDIILHKWVVDAIFYPLFMCMEHKPFDGIILHKLVVDWADRYSQNEAGVTETDVTLSSMYNINK